MEDRSTEVLSLLIPAVGGQGGGVLSEWIVEAAALDGYRVHGTSIPGVAQRTGSTTYYVELLTDRTVGEDAVFSLYPVPGALDVLLAPEYLEVARMIEAGFVSPARTTVVCSTHRLYTITRRQRPVARSIRVSGSTRWRARRRAGWSHSTPSPSPASAAPK
jgi:indolepyruvate ferredoxin oxidoreductase, beta subunit